MQKPIVEMGTKIHPIKFIWWSLIAIRMVSNLPLNGCTNRTEWICFVMSCWKHTKNSIHTFSTRKKMGMDALLTLQVRNYEISSGDRATVWRQYLWDRHRRFGSRTNQQSAAQISSVYNFSWNKKVLDFAHFSILFASIFLQYNLWEFSHYYCRYMRQDWPTYARKFY